MDVVGTKLPDRKQAGNTCKLQSLSLVFSNLLELVPLILKNTCVLHLYYLLKATQMFKEWWKLIFVKFYCQTTPGYVQNSSQGSCSTVKQCTQPRQHKTAVLCEWTKYYGIIRVLSPTTLQRHLVLSEQLWLHNEHFLISTCITKKYISCHL